MQKRNRIRDRLASFMFNHLTLSLKPMNSLAIANPYNLVLMRHTLSSAPNTLDHTWNGVRTLAQLQGSNSSSAELWAHMHLPLHSYRPLHVCLYALESRFYDTYRPLFVVIDHATRTSSYPVPYVLQSVILPFSTTTIVNKHLVAYRIIFKSR
jgi:hypothetical protein